MFLFALLIGIYSYLIFFLGLFGLLYKDVVIGVTVVFWLSVIWWYRKRLLRCFRGILKRVQDYTKRSFAFAQDDKRRVRNDESKKLFYLFGLLFVLQAGVNLIGALGPELGFDSLWYHLMLPKLYLENHSVFYIPGGILYYSAMPKLSEMLYIVGLSFGNEILVKLIHFSFGLLTCLALYKLSRKFFTPVVSLIAVVIFYANLVVAWESITAYVDLVRAFFELMALWTFVNYFELKKRKWLVYSAIMLGLAITTKVLAIGSLVIFIALLIYKNWKRVQDILLFPLIALAIPLPWFIFSYINTGNPVYPFFSEIYPVSPMSLSLIGFLRDVWGIFMYSPDPISPIYVMLLPLIVWLLWGNRGERRMRGIRVIGIYSLLAIVVWYFTPRTGGGRFLLPYLPAFSLLCAAVLSEVLDNKKKYGIFLGKFLLTIIIFISLTTIGYRFVANAKYLPVIIGKESKDTFLMNNLNFSFGDFYDVDGYFEKNIKSTDTVLLYGFHNLYYVDFPFIDSSWREPEDTFNYVAVQKSELPEEFSNWVLVYENEKTMVKLYKMPERVYTYK